MGITLPCADLYPKVLILLGFNHERDSSIPVITPAPCGRRDRRIVVAGRARSTGRGYSPARTEPQRAGDGPSGRRRSAIRRQAADRRSVHPGERTIAHVPGAPECRRFAGFRFCACTDGSRYADRNRRQLHLYRWLLRFDRWPAPVGARAILAGDGSPRRLDHGRQRHGRGARQRRYLSIRRRRVHRHRRPAAAGGSPGSC
jgi:hypothetical protein